LEEPEYKRANICRKGGVDYLSRNSLSTSPRGGIPGESAVTNQPTPTNRRTSIIISGAPFYLIATHMCRIGGFSRSDIIAVW